MSVADLILNMEPMTGNQMKRFAGGSHGQMHQFLWPFTRSAFSRLDHFGEDTFNADFWTTNGGTGATVFAIPATPGLGGTLVAATGTNATPANRRVNMYGPPIFKGDNNCMMIVRWHVGAAVSNVGVEMGWIDTMTNLSSSIEPANTDVDDATVWATGLASGGLLKFDRTATLTTTVQTSFESVATLNAGVKTNHGTLVPTASTYTTWMIGLIGNTLVTRIDDSNSSDYQKVTASAVEGGTLVRPWIFIEDPDNTTTKTITIDYIYLAMDL